MTVQPSLSINRGPMSGLSEHASGIACGVGAGALWGLVFLAPELVKDFSPLQLTIGRYLSYGLLSLFLIAPARRRLSATLTPAHWRTLCSLSFFGNILYYVLLSNAVRTGGIAMTSLVIGFLPVVVTIVGSREKEAPPLKRLLPSLFLCVCGAVCIGWQAISVSSDLSATRLIGLFFAVGALISWSIYAIANARALTRLPTITAHDWNLLTGIVTGAQSLLLIPLAVMLNSTQHSVNSWFQLGGVSMGIAMLASIAGNALWNSMSRRLPLTLVGQMILFETAFALIYGLLWEHRAPTTFETLAFFAVVGSVLSCIRAHSGACHNP